MLKSETPNPPFPELLKGGPDLVWGRESTGLRAESLSLFWEEAFGDWRFPLASDVPPSLAMTLADPN